MQLQRDKNELKETPHPWALLSDAEYLGQVLPVLDQMVEAVVALHSAGVIEPYNTIQANSLLLHDPTLPTVSLQIMALSYNTKKLKKEDLPKSWEDVINPKYKGVVALDDPLRAGPLSGLLAGLKEYWKDDARWTKYIRGLKALKVTVHKSTSAMFRLLVAGEYSIAMPSLLHDLIEEKEKGSPVDFVKSAAPVISISNRATRKWPSSTASTACCTMPCRRLQRTGNRPLFRASR